MADEVVVIALEALGADDRASVRELLARVDATDGHPALPDPQRLAVSAAERPDDVRGHVALARRGGVLVGLAVLSEARGPSRALHVVLDPAARRANGSGALARALVERALALAPTRTEVHLWVMQAGPADDARAAGLGFEVERDVLQMRVVLPLPADVLARTRPLETRAFVAGRDEAAWVETNNRAFASHPEQGGWTVAQLQARLESDWVDLDGFLVADDPDGPGLIGSCWTKIHRESTPVLGEIYVIAVDPRHHGHGWGRSLTVAGLEFLTARGIRQGMLYTESDNDAAVGLYRSLGFTVDHVDRSYRRFLA